MSRRGPSADADANRAGALLGKAAGQILDDLEAALATVDEARRLLVAAIRQQRNARLRAALRMGRRFEARDSGAN